SRVSTDRLLNNGDLHQPHMHSFSVDANGNQVDNTGTLLQPIAPGFWPSVTWENGPAVKNDRPYQNNTQFYDHIGQLFKTAQTTNVNLGLSGGKENSDYAF